MSRTVKSHKSYHAKTVANLTIATVQTVNLGHIARFASKKSLRSEAHKSPHSNRRHNFLHSRQPRQRCVKAVKHLLREGTVKSGSTIYPRLCSGPRSQIISSFICRLLGFQTRASRGCSPQFFKKGNFDQNYQKIVEKLKCRGPVSTFLAMIDPRYIRSIDGKSSIFSNGTLLF